MSDFRPGSFEDFHGQATVVNNLRVSVASALKQRRVHGHLLFVGAGGLGKTTLAMSVLPYELGTEARSVNCAAIEKPTDLTAVLTTVGEGQILFLDELHALLPAAREHLLTAMEDRKICVKIGDGASAKVLEVGLPHFTIIGATTRQGVLDGPLRSRFIYTHRLTPYSDQETAVIAQKHAAFRSVDLPDGAAMLLGRPAHGVARRAANLVDAAIDTMYATTDRSDLDVDIVADTLGRLGYVGCFDPIEWEYLTYLDSVTSAGLKTLADVLSETPATVEEVVEPWLIQRGLVIKRSAGRQISAEGKKKVKELR